jgi:hypothetical protein
VDGSLVAQCDDSQYSTLKFRNSTPKPETVMFLRFDSQRVLDYLDAPFFFQIGSFSQDLFLEVFGKTMFFKALVDVYYMAFRFLFTPVPAQDDYAALQFRHNQSASTMDARKRLYEGS